MSELKAALPLDRFRLSFDQGLLKSLGQHLVKQDFHAYLRTHLAGESQMLSDVDVTALVHYLVLTSSNDRFGLDLMELDVIALF